MARTSTKQGEILEFISDFSRENGFSPSVREICSAVGLKSTASVHYHLNNLKQNGSIAMVENQNRTISVYGASTPPEPSNHIPILGTVAAGEPILAEENILGYIPWDGNMDYFALLVQGDSMKDAGILAGDKIVIRPQQTANHGDIVVAMLGEEATVKRLSLKNNEVWLVPDNPDYEPIDGTEAAIIGKVHSVIREL